ncbi:2-oxoglutarate and iron-dependent oxygenase domain-containing protein [Mesorhizobium atlanticum]
MNAMQNLSFPVFDLGQFETASAARKKALGLEVDHICRSTGFLAVKNHGVPQAVIDAAWSKAKAFFDLPPEEKQRSKAPYKGYPYGYLGPELEALAKSRNVDTPPDLKESFNGGPPRVPPGLKDPEAWPSATPRRSGRPSPRASSKPGRPIMRLSRTSRCASCGSSPPRLICRKPISTPSSMRRSAR